MGIAAEDVGGCGRGGDLLEEGKGKGFDPFHKESIKLAEVREGRG